MRDERARLFVALELPEAARASLIAWRDRTAANAAGLRGLGAESLHVTLCFLGWVQAGEVDSISEACRELTGRPAPRLSLGRARWLPPKRPRVLAVELNDPERSLADAQSELSRLLAAGGWYRPEKRPYLAHVTVARVARGAKALPGALPEPPALQFEAGRVTLFRSHLSGGGARYELLSRTELSC